jgi:uncharacterized spore protein YtfJ
MKRYYFLLATLVLLLSLPVYGFATSQESQLSTILYAFSADNVIGKPQQIGEITIIPVFSAEVSFGYYSVGSDSEIQGSGSGGTSDFLPFALIVIDSENVRIIPVTNKKTLISQIVDALPDLLPVIQQVMGYFMIDENNPVINQNNSENSLSMESSGSDAETEVRQNRISVLYNEAYEELSIETCRSMYEEVKELLPSEMNNAKAHALYGYLTMQLIEKAPPLQQIRMAMEAQKEIDKALLLDPEDVLGLIGNGWMNLYHPAGKVEIAIASFEKALSVEPDNANALTGVIKSYEKANNKELVVEWAKKALQLYPESEFFGSFIE